MAEIIKRDVVQVVVPDEQWPDTPDVYEAAVRTYYYPGKSKAIAFQIDDSNLTVWSKSIPYYIELFNAMQDYVNTHKEEK